MNSGILLLIVNVSVYIKYNEQMKPFCKVSPICVIL